MNFTQRKKLSRFCIAVALLLVGGYLFLPAISSSLGIEFVSQDEEELFSHAQLPSLLVALSLLFVGLLLTITHWMDIVIRLLLFGLVTFILYVVVLFSVFSGMCAWTTHSVLFEQRADPSTIIALRSMGCGATDSGPPAYGTFKITPLTSHFIRVTKVDTTTLDHSQWQRVHQRPTRHL
jgi:hypothetical protein